LWLHTQARQGRVGTCCMYSPPCRSRACHMHFHTSTVKLKFHIPPFLVTLGSPLMFYAQPNYSFTHIDWSSGDPIWWEEILHKRNLEDLISKRKNDIKAVRAHWIIVAQFNLKAIVNKLQSTWIVFYLFCSSEVKFIPVISIWFDVVDGLK
jgi:hypothetical protein